MSTEAAPFPITRSEAVGEDFAFYATATALNLCTVPGKPQRCARQIIALAAGTWTLLKNSSGVDAPPGAVFQGFALTAHVSSITSTSAIMVVW